jgi:hypothetical protein
MHLCLCTNLNTDTNKWTTGSPPQGTQIQALQATVVASNFREGTVSRRTFCKKVTSHTRTDISESFIVLSIEATFQVCGPKLYVTPTPDLSVLDFFFFFFAFFTCFMKYLLRLNRTIITLLGRDKRPNRVFVWQCCMNYTTIFGEVSPSLTHSLIFHCGHIKHFKCFSTYTKLLYCCNCSDH